MSQKKNTNLTVRLDDAMTARLERFEKTTPLGRAEITRQALDGILRHFETYGNVVFPVQLSAKPHDLNDPETASAVETYLMENEGSLMRKFIKKLEEENHRYLKSVVKDFHADKETNPYLKYWPEERAMKTVLLDGGVSAGEEVKKVNRRLLEAERVYPDGCFALKVFGHRCHPIVQNGDIIVVQTWNQEMAAEENLLAIAVVRDKDHIRQLYALNKKDGKTWLTSFDVDAPPAPPIEEVKIEALFVEFHTHNYEHRMPTLLTSPEDFFVPKREGTPFTGLVQEMDEAEKEWLEKGKSEDAD